MKNRLLKIVKVLLFPVLWCRNTLLEASEICLDCDPVGFTDYLNYVAPDRVQARVRHTEKAARSGVFQRI